MKLYGKQDLAAQKKVPLVYQPFVYVGPVCEAYTPGDIYYPVSSGYHWWKPIGFVIWVSCNGHRKTPPINSDDVDYCEEFSVEAFYRHFWKA